MLRLAAAEYAAAGHPPGCLVVDGATNTTEASRDVAEELRGFREGTKKAIADKIAADKRAGLLPPDTDAPALATFYAAMVTAGRRPSPRGTAPRGKMGQAGGMW